MRYFWTVYPQLPTFNLYVLNFNLSKKSMRNFIAICFLLLSGSVTAQVKFPDLSPQGSIRQKVGLTTIFITYERPAARGRKVFGGLVPYNKMWRTGAGNCTRIKFDDAVMIAGKLIHAGTYSLFTIPDPQEWTVILNSDTTLYGTGRYDERKDAVRFKAKSDPIDRYYESLTIDVDVIPDNAALNISWENTRVTFEIKTETSRKISKIVDEQLLSGNVKDPQVLAMGAEYYYFLNQDLETGLALINRAIDLETKSWYYTLKVDILTKSRKYSEAIETLKHNMAYVKKNPENWSKEELSNVVKEQELQMNELQSKIKK